MCRPTSGLGERSSGPPVIPCIIGRGPGVKDQDGRRKLLVIRKQTPEPAGAAGEEEGLPGLTQLYMPSVSTHRGLQGPAAGAPDRLLRGSARSADRSALCLIAPRSLTPSHVDWRTYRFIAQRRIRHGARQRQLDVRAAAGEGAGADLDRLWPLITRPVGPPIDNARAAGRRRLSAGARDDDAIPGRGPATADGYAAAIVLSTTPR